MLKKSISSSLRTNEVSEAISKTRLLRPFGARNDSFSVISKIINFYLLFLAFTCIIYRGQRRKQKEAVLARDNYSYKKYQRELAKKKKREEKMQRKLDKKNMQSKDDLGQGSNEGAVVNPSP